jgi:hypothetical protein
MLFLPDLLLTGCRMALRNQTAWPQVIAPGNPDYLRTRDLGNG